MSYRCTHLKEVSKGDDLSYHVYLLEDPDNEKHRLTGDDFQSIERELGTSTAPVGGEDDRFCTEIIHAYVAELRDGQLGEKYRDFPMLLVTAVPPAQLFEAKKGIRLGPDYALYPLGPLERGERDDQIKHLCDTLAAARVDLASLGDLMPDIAVLSAGFPIELTDFEHRIKNDRLGDILFERWQNSDKSLEAGAYIASLVMIGSLLEGALFAFACNRCKEAKSSNAAPTDKNGKPKPLDEWNLAQLIDVAYECKWIGKYVNDFGRHVRDYRNMVHPAHQLRLKAEPNEHMCAICWEVVRAALHSLV